MAWLGLWALDGKHTGDGYGFPFDRPLLSFIERLIDMDRQMPHLLDLSKNDESNNIQYLAQSKPCLSVCRSTGASHADGGQ